MAPRTDSFDLGHLQLSSGEGRRVDVEVGLEDFAFGGQEYATAPARLPAQLSISRMVDHGWSLRLRFSAGLTGPCMRCLDPATPSFGVDAREVDVPGGGDELDSPYVSDEVLDVRSWARDALALAMGSQQIVCRPDCAGLCPVCGENLNHAGPGHAHEPEPDPRWAKLRELRLE